VAGYGAIRARSGARARSRRRCRISDIPVSPFLSVRPHLTLSFRAAGLPVIPQFNVIPSPQARNPGPALAVEIPRLGLGMTLIGIGMTKRRGRGMTGTGRTA